MPNNTTSFVSCRMLPRCIVSVRLPKYAQVSRKCATASTWQTDTKETVHCKQTRYNREPMNPRHYRPQRSWAKVIFSQACVCPQGGSTSVHTGIYPPESRPPPPPSRHPPWDQTSPWSRQPPGADIPGKQTPAYGQWSTSGRFASYWNAFLLNATNTEPVLGSIHTKGKWGRKRIDKTISKQECNPVGCVPPARYHMVGRGSMSGGLPNSRVPTFSHWQNSMIFPWFFQVF